MSNDLAIYNGGAVAPYESDGVVTHAMNSPVTVTSEDRQIIESVANTFETYGLDRERTIRAAEQVHRDWTAEQARSDDNDRRGVRAQMQKEWGGDYGANVKRIKAFVDSLPLSLQDVLWDGRTAEGTLALNDPSVLRWLLRLSQPAGAYQGGSVEQEMVEIVKLMGKPGSAYWKGPNAEKMQARYRELISQRG